MDGFSASVIRQRDKAAAATARSTRVCASERRNDISAGTCFWSSVNRSSVSMRRNASRRAVVCSTTFASNARPLSHAFVHSAIAASSRHVA